MLLVDHIFPPMSLVMLQPSLMLLGIELGTDPGSTTGPARFLYAPLVWGLAFELTRDPLNQCLPGLYTKQVYPFLMGRPQPAH